MYRVIFSRRILGIALLAGLFGATAKANDAAAPGLRSVGRSPSQGLRPIGGPSPVDAFARPQGVAGSQGFAGSRASVNPDIANPVAQPVLPAAAEIGDAGQGETGRIAQTAYMQGGGFAVPPSGAAAPPSISNGGAVPRPAPAVTGGTSGGFATGAPPVTNGLQAPPLSGGSTPPTTAPPVSTAPLPDGLQPVPSTAPLTAPPRQQTYPLTAPLTASPSDVAPVPQPQLSSNWATADNCNLVSYPSGYRAEFGACVPASVVPITYAAPPAVIVPPTIMPGVAPPVIVPATAGHRPLFTLGQQNYNVQLGQGIIGQPKAYVPGQYFRNFIRYLSP